MGIILICFLNFIVGIYYLQYFDYSACFLNKYMVLPNVFIVFAFIYIKICDYNK